MQTGQLWSQLDVGLEALLVTKRQGQSSPSYETERFVHAVGPEPVANVGLADQESLIRARCVNRCTDLGKRVV